MANRFTDSQKWDDPWFRKLPCKYKTFWIFLLDKCNHAGIWKVDFESASFHIGETINEEEAFSFLNGRIHKFSDKWFITKFIFFQYGILSETNRVHNSVMGLLKKEGLYRVYQQTLEGLKDKDKNKDMDKEGGYGGKQTKFILPTIEEIKSYCLERKNNVNPDKWLAHYEAKGWMIGKNKMKDWKAAVRTWEEGGITSEQEADRERLKTDLKQAYSDLKIKEGFLGDMDEEDQRRGKYLGEVDRLKKKIGIIERRLQ